MPLTFSRSMPPDPLYRQCSVYRCSQVTRCGLRTPEHFLGSVPPDTSKVSFQLNPLYKQFTLRLASFLGLSPCANYHFSVLQAMKSWAEPGNEATLRTRYKIPGFSDNFGILNHAGEWLFYKRFLLGTGQMPHLVGGARGCLVSCMLTWSPMSRTFYEVKIVT